LSDFGGIVISVSYYNKIQDNKKLQGRNFVYQNINYFVMAMMISSEGYGSCQRDIENN
jgi:DNA-directed RNA polymerase subunit E'/Rpb7